MHALDGEPFHRLQVTAGGGQDDEQGRRAMGPLPDGHGAAEPQMPSLMVTPQPSLNCSETIVIVSSPVFAV